MLDVYCYSGGFAHAGGAPAGRGGAGASTARSRRWRWRRKAAALNGVGARCRFERGEAFETLETLARPGERFDIVVADPPAFVKSKKELNQAARGYRKLARLAARPGGARRLPLHRLLLAPHDGRNCSPSRWRAALATPSGRRGS